jgi:uncharacterized protein
VTQLQPENHIDYLELPATDIAATKQFYTALFGWKFTDYGSEYSSFFDGRNRGGFTTDAAVSRRGILLVIYARDLAASQARIQDAGGKIVKDTFEFPGGRRFHFTDPNGNELAVWSDATD